MQQNLISTNVNWKQRLQDLRQHWPTFSINMRWNFSILLQVCAILLLVLLNSPKRYSTRVHGFKMDSLLQQKTSSFPVISKYCVSFEDIHELSKYLPGKFVFPLLVKRFGKLYTRRRLPIFSSYSHLNSHKVHNTLPFSCWLIGTVLQGIDIYIYSVARCII